MQTIWKGTVSFGLVSIPVRLFSATQERGVSFHQVHEADGGRIRYKRYCEKDGEEVAYRDIAKGYELPDGETIILTDSDFEALPLNSSRTVDVLQFVPLEQVDPVYVNRSYYLQADGPGLKPYVLLRDALQRAGKAALVKVALRNRESLAVLRPRGEVLMMQTMLWPDEVRDPAVVAPEEDVTVREQEVAMAESYIETLAGDLELEDYTDDYREALESLVSAKAAGREMEPRESGAADSGVVVDLMEALRQSVEAAQKGRTGAGGPERSRQDSVEAGAAEADEDPGATQTATRRPGAKATAEKRSGAGTTAPRKAAAGTAGAGTKTSGTRATGTKATGTKATGTKATGTKATGSTAPARKATGSTGTRAKTAAPAAKKVSRAPAPKKTVSAAQDSAPTTRRARKSA